MCERLCCPKNVTINVPSAVGSDEIAKAVAWEVGGAKSPAQDGRESLQMRAKVEARVDDLAMTDNTVRLEAGEGKARLHLNGLDITGMINPGWTLVHDGDGPEATLTVTFPVRVM